MDTTPVKAEGELVSPYWCLARRCLEVLALLCSAHSSAGVQGSRPLTRNAFYHLVPPCCCQIVLNIQLPFGSADTNPAKVGHQLVLSLITSLLLDESGSPDSCSILTDTTSGGESEHWLVLQCCCQVRTEPCFPPQSILISWGGPRAVFHRCLAGRGVV